MYRIPHFIPFLNLHTFYASSIDAISSIYVLYTLHRVSSIASLDFYGLRYTRKMFEVLDRVIHLPPTPPNYVKRAMYLESQNCFITWYLWLYQSQWFSGKIRACHARAPCSIHGCDISFVLAWHLLAWVLSICFGWGFEYLGFGLDSVLVLHRVWVLLLRSCTFFARYCLTQR
jgi:hypothetical protein